MRDGIMNKTDTDRVDAGVGQCVGHFLQSPNRAAEIFADPVGYLAGLGITAEIVHPVEPGSALPAAA